MSMTRQIVNLVRSDLYRSRWYVAALFAACCINAASVIWAAGDSTDGIGMTIFSAISAFGIVLIAILLVIGTVIQNDSPSDDLAFWRAVPVSPLALVIGKAVTLVFAIAVPVVITEAIAWSALPVAASDAANASLKALADMTMFLLFPIIIAALTPSFRSFILATVLIIAATTTLSTVSFVVAGNRQMVGTPWFRVVAGASALIMLGWLVSLYWSRTSATRKRVLSVGIVTFCSYAPVSVFTVTQKLHSKFATVAVDTTQHNFGARVAGRDVFLTFDIPSPRVNDRLSIVSPDAELVASGGNVKLFVNGGIDSRNTTMNGVPQPGRLLIRLVEGVNMTIIDSNTAKRIERVTLQLIVPSGSDAPNVTDGRLAVRFNAFLETETVDTLLDIPADTGHRTVYRGWNFRTSLIERADSGRRFKLEGSSATPNSGFDAQNFSFMTPSADHYRLRAQGYFIPERSDAEYKLVSVVSGDSVLLTQGAGFQTNLAMPILSSAFARISFAYQQFDKPAGEASLPDMQNARFLMTRWKYAHHSPIGATVRFR